MLWVGMNAVGRITFTAVSLLSIVAVTGCAVDAEPGEGEEEELVIGDGKADGKFEKRIVFSMYDERPKLYSVQCRELVHCTAEIELTPEDTILDETPEMTVVVTRRSDNRQITFHADHVGEADYDHFPEFFFEEDTLDDEIRYEDGKIIIESWRRDDKFQISLMRHSWDNNDKFLNVFMVAKWR
jgi:hypothetical protein